MQLTPGVGVVAPTQIYADMSHGSTEDGVDEQETILERSPSMSIMVFESIIVTEPALLGLM